MKPKEINILLVEDNPGDIRLVREALDECGMHHRLEVVTDGVQALEHLRRGKTAPDESLPDLILLDLNLPKKDGREVLMELKGDVDLRRLPVVVFSSSEAGEDILGSYDHHANCYVCKPLELDAYIKVIGQIVRFWMDPAELPPKVFP
jgi:chemotaxis family two-component system response regulator Rcp1